jgi:FMN-dependent NADH-azoreductase
MNRNSPKTFLRVGASIQVDKSASKALADSVQAEWQAEHPNGKVVTRELGLRPFPARAWMDAACAERMPAEDWRPEHAAAIELAKGLADEMIDADSIVVTSPLYNWGISEHLKAWIDLLLTDARLSPYGLGKMPLKDKPTVLIVTRGGDYRKGSSREGWDHATPWIKRVLGEVFGMDVKTVEADLTLADLNPALADLRGTAQEIRERAHELAKEHGKTLSAGAKK